MKKFLLSLCIVVTHYSQAQVHTAMPPDANTFYDKAMPLVKSSLRNLIMQVATVLKSRRANADSLFNALHTNPLLKGMGDENIAGVTTLIIVQASKDADEDLKKMVLGMKDNGISRTSNTSQSAEEINEKKQIALQLILIRKSNMAEEINFVLQKLSDKENIISSLK